MTYAINDADQIIEARRALLRDRMAAIGYCQLRSPLALSDGCWCKTAGPGGAVAACPAERPHVAEVPDPAPFRMPEITRVPWFSLRG